jgi:hypothetical protein
MSWQDTFSETMERTPQTGDILMTLDGSPVRLNIDLQEGKAPFIYGVAYVPCIVGAPVKWCARGLEDKSLYGWKCILMNNARDKIIRETKLKKVVTGVTALKVVRPSKANCSLLVEVYEPK